MIMDGNSSDMEQLGEDEDDGEEEWIPNAMLTEENSDSTDEEDLRDESVNLMSTETEGLTTTTEDTPTKQSVRGKVKRKEYRWRKVQYEPPAVEFDDCVEEASEDRCDWTLHMCFKQFVTDEMLQEITEQTNLYSVQKQGKSVNTTSLSTDVQCTSLLGDGDKAHHSL